MIILWSYREVAKGIEAPDAQIVDATGNLVIPGKFSLITDMLVIPAYISPSKIYYSNFTSNQWQGVFPSWS